MKYLLLFIILCFSCDAIRQSKHYEPLKLKGSESLHQAFSSLSSDFERLQDTLKVQLEGGGSRTGLMAIKEKTADIGLSSFPFKLDSILGYNHSVQEKIVGYDVIVIINHMDNPVLRLSDRQISNIYSGIITDWSEVGGNPGTIMPVVRDSNSGTQRFFTEHFKVFELAPSAVVARENREIVDSVISNRNGIGFIGYSYYTTLVKNVMIPSLVSRDSVNFIPPNPEYIDNGEYPLKRSLRIYFDREHDARVDAFLKYLKTTRAKQILESYGLIAS